MSCVNTENWNMAPMDTKTPDSAPVESAFAGLRYLRVLAAQLGGVPPTSTGPAPPDASILPAHEIVVVVFSQAYFPEL